MYSEVDGAAEGVVIIVAVIVLVAILIGLKKIGKSILAAMMMCYAIIKIVVGPADEEDEGWEVGP